MEFTTGEETESEEAGRKQILSGDEISKELDRLLEEKANNQRIRDWIEVCGLEHSDSSETLEEKKANIFFIFH